MSHARLRRLARWTRWRRPRPGCLAVPSQRLTIGDTDRRYRALQRRLFDIADFVAKTFGDKFAFDRREILKLPSLRQFIGAAGDHRRRIVVNQHGSLLSRLAWVVRVVG